MGGRIGKLVGLFGFLLCFWKVPLFAVSDIPDEDAWVTNGPVYAVVRDEKKGITYIGGEFTYVGPRTCYGVPIDTKTGEPVSKFPRVNGEIYAVVSDGSGGWYIGGDFTKVGKEERNRLAHIKKDGTVDNWNPDADWPVYALAVSDGILYVGGGFSEIGGKTRKCLASFDISTGELTDWDPGADDWVEALAISSDGKTLYVGGYFTSFNGGDDERNCLASFDITGVTPTITDWAPNVTSENVYWTAVYALAVGDGTLYVGGYFTEIDGQGRSCLASFDITSDIPTIKAWNPGADSDVDVLAVSSNGILYVGGDFIEIDGETRNYLASFDISTGNLTEWDPNVNDYVYALAVSSDGKTLYVGGDFTEIDGETKTYLASFNITGVTPTITDWAPNVISENDYYTAVYALAVNPGVVYVGGDFDFIGGEVRNNIAALDSNGKLTAWNPGVEGYVNALAISSDGETLYVGGWFSEIGGKERNNIAALDTSTGAVIDDWNLGANNDVNALAISSDGKTLYAGGYFDFIGGQYRDYIAALDASTGAIIDDWNPDGANDSVYALAISSDGKTLYAGGWFDSIGGQNIDCIAALDASTGAVIESWNPDGANDSVYALAVSSDGKTLYAGGYFTSIGGQSRNCIAALDASTGEAIDDWDPGADDCVDALAVSDGILYVGGEFTEIGSTDRNCLAALDIKTGEPTAWNPNVEDLDEDYEGPAVYALAVSNNGSVYVGGAFATIGGDIFPCYAQFSGSISPLMKGDINEDGEIDISDVILCLRMALGLPVTIEGETYTSYPDSLVNCANINGDEEIDISDVILVLRMALGLPITINGQTYESPYNDL